MKLMQKKMFQATALTLASLLALGHAQAAQVVAAPSIAKIAAPTSTPQASISSLAIDVAEAKSVGLAGTPGNTVLNFQVGGGALISSLDWNVTLSAFGASWLSDMEVRFSSSAGNDGVWLTPGSEGSAGTMSYIGAVNLLDAGLAFNVQSDGILRVEFAETMKDLAPDLPDGQWDAGQIQVGITSAVPEPSSYALMAFGLLAVVGGLRRR
ncbi:PEP-CTERM sorting domain-containing protein [Roseateles sp. PN1]|uniref:PEP-CTERM sorting domain-containing protein n=1 Tax=Roseateles sp. PN1 TaxID=3137372 RepID=UPI0031388E68